MRKIGVKCLSVVTKDLGDRQPKNLRTKRKKLCPRTYLLVQNSDCRSVMFTNSGIGRFDVFQFYRWLQNRLFRDQRFYVRHVLTSRLPLVLPSKLSRYTTFMTVYGLSSVGNTYFWCWTQLVSRGLCTKYSAIELPMHNMNNIRGFKG